jgi:hypothetical protein
LSLFVFHLNQSNLQIPGRATNIKMRVKNIFITTIYVGSKVKSKNKITTLLVGDEKRVVSDVSTLKPEDFIHLKIGVVQFTQTHRGVHIQNHFKEFLKLDLELETHTILKNDNNKVASIIQKDIHFLFTSNQLIVVYHTFL